jgi:hypothetical protein
MVNRSAIPHCWTSQQWHPTHRKAFTHNSPISTHHSHFGGVLISPKNRWPAG